MSINVSIVCIGLILCMVVCDASTPVRKCSNGYPFPLDVQIDDCDVLPCVVYKGTLSTMDVQFVGVKEIVHHITADVKAHVFGLVLPYPLPGEIGDVCRNLLYGAYCPIYATEDVTYGMKFPVDNTFPEVNAKVEVQLLDEKSDVVACFMVDIKVRKFKKF